jgi:hypothetical protein
MRKRFAVFPSRVASCSLLLWAACSGKEKPGGGATVPEGSILAPAARECAFRSACAGESVGGCVNFLRNDDAFELEGGAAREALLARAGCVERAQSCDDYFACVYPGAQRAACTVGPPSCRGNELDQCLSLGAAGTLTVTTDCTSSNTTCRTVDGAGACLSSFECGTTETTYCSGNTLVWCYKPEYGTPRPIPIDCAQRGLVCDGNMCRDEPRRACTEHVCDGTIVRRCSQSTAYSLDCRVIDPSFTCFSDAGQLRCGESQPDARCPLDPISSQNVWCDGDVAQACVWGRVVSVDCAAAGASCVGASPFEVRCQPR